MLLSLKVKNKMIKSPVKIIFLLAGGIMVFFILLNYWFDLDVYQTRYLTLGNLIKVLMGIFFITGSFLAYKHYKKN
jgi:hypothetical protein